MQIITLIIIGRSVSLSCAQSATHHWDISLIDSNKTWRDLISRKTRTDGTGNF